jgi:hypothetical protein
VDERFLILFTTVPLLEHEKGRKKKAKKRKKTKEKPKPNVFGELSNKSKPGTSEKPVSCPQNDNLFVIETTDRFKEWQAKQEADKDKARLDAGRGEYFDSDSEAGLSPPRYDFLYSSDEDVPLKKRKAAENALREKWVQESLSDYEEETEKPTNKA